MLQAVIAEFDGGIAAEILEIGIVRMNGHQAGRGTPAVKRALRATQDFDAFDVVAAAHTIVDAVHVNGGR